MNTEIFRLLLSDGAGRRLAEFGMPWVHSFEDDGQLVAARCREFFDACRNILQQHDIATHSALSYELHLTADSRSRRQYVLVGKLDTPVDHPLLSLPITHEQLNELVGHRFTCSEDKAMRQALFTHGIMVEADSLQFELERGSLHCGCRLYVGPLKNKP